MRNCLFDLVTRRCERLNFRKKNIIELSQTVEIAVDDRDLSSKANCHFGGFGTDDSAADDNDVSGGNSRNATEQNSLSAVHFFEISSTDLYRHTSGNFGHRDQQWQTASTRDRFVRNASYFSVEHLLCQLKFRR